MLRYNAPRRILAALLNRLFGISLIAFYDDLGSPAIFELGKESLHLLTVACSLQGAISNLKKCGRGSPPFLFRATGAISFFGQ